MKKYAWGADPDFFGPQMYYRVVRMMTMVRRYIRGTYVLDAGCGDGVLTFVLAQNKYVVNAQDASSECVRHLKKKVLAKRLSGSVTVKKGNLLALTEKNNTFDGVVCGEVLEHIKNDSQVIREFYRVLKPGGVCVISTPGKPHLWHEIDDISGHIRRYTQAQLRQKFESAGFTVRECYYWGFPLNGLWHRFVFKPFILKKMRTKGTITQSHGLVARVVKTSRVQKILSKIFHVDRLFDWTGFGEFLLLVATK